MKAKNILKIGIFSIVILSFLISPILKSITPETDAFTLWTSGGTSTTGLNFEDYLSTCISSGANNTIANIPTAYTVLCCNDKDHNWAVRNSSSYSTIVANCETAQENASDQAIPVFDEEWCTDALKYGQLSQIDNAIAYIEKCCKPEDSKTKYIKDRCKNSYDTVNTYLQTETVYEEEVDIKDCVYPKGDGGNTTFMTLYNDASLYLEKCCNFSEEEKTSLKQAEKDLLDYRCENLSVEDNFVPLGPGDVGETITPPPPPETLDNDVSYWGGVETVKEEIKEKSAEGICADVGTWEVFTFKITFTPPSIQIIQNFEGFTEKVFCIVQKGIVEGLGKMFAGIMNMEVNMILWAFNPDTYGGFVNNPAVQGTEDSPGVWNFLRNFVNILLVLALVVIAIASILGIKKYSWQQILWKLIIVALLVNFSLVIAGMVLDTSNFLTYYFLNLAKGENENLATAMISSLDTETISDKDKYDLPGVSGATQEETASWGFRFGQAFLVMFVLIFIGLFAVIALLAVFLAMIVRSFILIVLLCLSPIAFAAWIFPDTEKFWKMWWQQFIKWCTYSIIFAFMLYIGVFAVNNLAIKSVENIGMMAFIVQVVLFSMFLVGGLIFSLQGGGVASQMVMKQSSKIGAAAGAFVSKKTTGAVKESSTYKKAGEFLTKVPLLGGVGQEMMVAGEKAKAGRVKEHEKNLENVGLGSLKELEKAHPPSPLDRNAYERRIGLTNKLAGEGELGKESVEFIKMHRGDARLNASAITKAIPHHFKLVEGQLLETERDIAKKAKVLGSIKAGKMEKVQASDFIKDTMKEREDRARETAINRGKTKEQAEQAAKKAADLAFDKISQEIIKTLSPAQAAAFWSTLSPKDLIKKGWGGPNGKIIEAIKKDQVAKDKFKRDLNDSRPLRGIAGISPDDLNKNE